MVTSAERLIGLRYASTCRDCGMSLSVGTEAMWDPAARTTACISCPRPADPFPAPPPPVPSGVAGRSAQAEGDRRVASRERRIRERFPHVGGLILAFTEPPQTTRVWAQGAVGERKVGKRLAKPAAAGTIVALHDLRVPGSKANIDHVVVGPVGVYVIDTKRYLNKKIEARSTGTLFRAQPQRLFVDGRDQTKLVEAMGWQVTAVRSVVEDLGGDVTIDVMPVLCFVDGEWDLFSGPYEIGGVYVTGPRDLVRYVTRPGGLDANERLVVGHHLASRLPQA